MDPHIPAQVIFKTGLRAEFCTQSAWKLNFQIHKIILNICQY